MEFGDLSGVIYNRRTDRLIGGHQRVTALSDSEINILNKYDPPTPSGTTSDGFIEINGEKYSYREVDWDESKELAANIAANKSAGDWDYQKLSEIVLQLDTENFDLELTMFDQSELDRLIGGWESDIESIEKVKENLDGIDAVIKITCPQELKDEVLIYLKAKLLETSFEGVHIE